MKLTTRITIRLSVVLTILLAVWAVLFYIAIVDEINDEVDDSLEDYSEHIMMRALAGEQLPTESNNSNNQFYLSNVSAEYANSRPHIKYKDSMMYIPLKMETEPARVLATIFKDGQGQYYELTVLTPTIEKQDLQEAILHWIIFLYVILLIVIILVNVWVYRQSYRPFYRLLTWIDNYQLDGKNSPLENDTNIVEFRKMNEAVLKSLKRVEDVFEEQKKFIGNASHETQTPLAVCRNRIENLMEDASLNESQMLELDKVRQTLVYMTSLNRTLLLLAKIENKQFTVKKDIELNGIVKKIVDDFEEVYQSMNIHIHVSENGILRVNINDTLATILISNLIKNSYIHNKSGGLIDIRITDNSMCIENTGTSTPLDTSRIFDPFYKDSKREYSTGLGLALVRSICETENLQINYSFKQEKHCFEISSK